MEEATIFRRRNRLKKHFVNVSNVLLYCYEFVSDAAKITFQVIDGFDWESKETGESKGFVFPAIETVAKIRHTSIRTIQRHILELIKAKLLTRVRQRNKPSTLYIEEVSEEEEKKYFQYFDAKETTRDPLQPDTAAKLRNDKHVVSDKARETTNMSFAYKEENEKKENEMNVNAHCTQSEEKNRYGMQGIRALLKRFDGVENASKRVSKKTNGLTRKPAPWQTGNQGNQKTRTVAKQHPEEKIKRDYLATEMATELNDEKSVGCYRVIAQKVPQHIIFETMASVKETWKDGKITKSRGALFVDLIKTYCDKKQIDLHFSPLSYRERNKGTKQRRGGNPYVSPRGVFV